MTSQNQEKVEELRQSAQALAKQALETAELGMRLVKSQLETVGATQPPQVAEVQQTLQNTAATAETKAKELFTLATNFMTELNDKWQPGTASAPKASEEKPKAEKIDIE